jgi:hypothetical protein
MRGRGRICRLPFLLLLQQPPRAALHVLAVVGRRAHATPCRYRVLVTKRFFVRSWSPGFPFQQVIADRRRDGQLDLEGPLIAAHQVVTAVLRRVEAGTEFCCQRGADTRSRVAQRSTNPEAPVWRESALDWSVKIRIGSAPLQAPSDRRTQRRSRHCADRCSAHCPRPGRRATRYRSIHAIQQAQLGSDLGTAPFLLPWVARMSLRCAPFLSHYRKRDLRRPQCSIT